MKRKTRNTFWMVGLTLVLLVMVGTALAQDKPADNMQIFLESVKADKKLFVAENMQFTEGEAKAFWPVYERYQEELFLLRTRTLKLIKDYLATYEDMPNSTAKKLLDEYMTIEQLRLKLDKTYLPKFRKVLSDAKVLRYFQIENKTNAALYYELAATIPYLKTESDKTKGQYDHEISSFHNHFIGLCVFRRHLCRAEPGRRGICRRNQPECRERSDEALRKIECCQSIG